MEQQIIWCYLVLINLIAFSLYGIDKAKARMGKWRIPELHLLLVAVVGGSIGALCGMFFFHHKTQHLKFRIGLPLILILQLIIVGYFLYK
jgi:uncharacterized membrane protein YsdA (DUF1294 family)